MTVYKAMATLSLKTRMGYFHDVLYSNEIPFEIITPQLLNQKLSLTFYKPL